MLFQPLYCSKKAFTLIELLIVVAIIAILAAIAVPNFLEAQTRAKVSRVKNDLRALGTAVETYRIDNNRYPICATFWAPTAFEKMASLTTPVSYMSSILRDPFLSGTGKSVIPEGYGNPGVVEDTYLYNLGTVLNGGQTGKSFDEKNRWSLTAIGPDIKLDWPYYAFDNKYIGTDRSDQYIQYIYDPTNGSISSGEIFYRGGRSSTNASGLYWK